MEILILNDKIYDHSFMRYVRHALVKINKKTH